MTQQYRLRVEDQAGAVELLTAIGALAEIEQVVVGHCVDYAPERPYRPQEIKKRLAPAGWVPEVRVPPFDAQRDELPINERVGCAKAITDFRPRSLPAFVNDPEVCCVPLGALHRAAGRAGSGSAALSLG
jgi:hypothetical protein